jgi:DnaJ-class molecular chaperone
MSRFVHPDKNKDDLERSQQAFEAVNTAHKMLTDEEVGPRCRQVIEEAKRRVNEQRDISRMYSAPHSFNTKTSRTAIKHTNSPPCRLQGTSD